MTAATIRLTAVTLAATMLAAATVAPGQAAADSQGCPVGDVCIYPGAGWDGGHPQDLFYRYCIYNFGNLYGVHRVFSNATGGTEVYLCTSGT